MPTTSRAIVRTGIAVFFGGSTFDTEARAYRSPTAPLVSNGLSSVRAYQSKRVADQDYVIEQAFGRGMGAYMVVEMPVDVEVRQAIPQQTGRRHIAYTVILHLYHLAYQQHAEDAEADVDALVEAVKDLIHTDPTLGGTCYQAGEGHYGIRSRIFPATLVKNEITATYSQVQFLAEVEIIS